MRQDSHPYDFGTTASTRARGPFEILTIISSPAYTQNSNKITATKCAGAPSSYQLHLYECTYASLAPKTRVASPPHKPSVCIQIYIIKMPNILTAGNIIKIFCQRIREAAFHRMAKDIHGEETLQVCLLAPSSKLFPATFIFINLHARYMTQTFWCLRPYF